MRSLPVQRLTAVSFADAARATPYLMVRVEPGLPKLHRGISRFFSHQYPDLFAFGTLPLRETRASGWWDRNFQTAVGPVRGARTGYWLLQEGEVVGHHLGQVRANLDYTDRSQSTEDAQRGQRELEWIRRIAFGDVPVDSVDLTVAVELIAYFDGVVYTRQNRAGFGEDGTRSAEAGKSQVRVSAQSVAIPGASGDPFQVLKIAFDADDDAIRAAYKLQMKLNHPDKVSHMSPEIQDYAAAQVRVIKAAYDALASVRSSPSKD